MFDELKPDGLKRDRLDTITVERPRCPKCQSVGLERYRSIDQGDGTRLVWMQCRESDCRWRFKVVLE